MMWGFGLWGLCHIAVFPDPSNLVLAGSIAVLALVGAALQDSKKERLQPDIWRAWEAKTSYRSEEHTSELQSLMRISYAVFCLKKKKRNITKTNKNQQITTKKDKHTITHLNNSYSDSHTTLQTAKQHEHM